MLTTMSLGFKDRVYLRYEPNPDRAAVPPLTFLRIFVNVQYALVALQSIMYVSVPVFQAQICS